MKFTVQREALLKPLTIVAGAVERRQTMPILSNMLFKLDTKTLTITGTDLEVELTASVKVDNVERKGEATLPARKVVDICKSLPENSELKIEVENNKAVLKSGKSRFTLTTLPAADFPSVQRDKKSFSVTVNQKDFGDLIHKTAFSMAQQDVRYYLNGMLWELGGDSLRAVATDGHRLAVADITLIEPVADIEARQVIVPRKGIIELTRLLSDEEGANIELEFGVNHIRAAAGNLIFVSKLVDGKFPDYQRVLPKGGNKVVTADRVELKAALTRAAILSNEKFRGIRFLLESELLGIQANNPEQEEASEEIAVDYNGESLEMGFNVSYLIEILGVLRSSSVKITLLDANSSALIEDGDDNNNAQYVVMPMRL